MADGVTTIEGIAIPFASPLFLSVVGLHVLLGLACTIAGVVAMLSKKGRVLRMAAVFPVVEEERLSVVVRQTFEPDPKRSSGQVTGCKRRCYN